MNILKYWNKPNATMQHRLHGEGLHHTGLQVRRFDKFLLQYLQYVSIQDTDIAFFFI